jgi:hypothetical protein
LDKTQRGTVSRNTILKPGQRYEEIMKIIRNNQLDRDPYLKELNIRVQDKEMLKLKGNDALSFMVYKSVFFVV